VKAIAKYYDVLWELAWRDIRLQYRRPYLGFLWMFIIPLATSLIYKVLFSDFMRVQSGTYPFFLHLMSAMLPWNFFASSVQRGAGSILHNRHLLPQLSFPKILLPLAVVFAHVIQFLPSLGIYLLLVRLFGVPLSGFLFLLPAVLLAHIAITTGVVLLAASLQVFYRDVEYILQVLLMVFFFLTPGVYTLAEVSARISRDLFGIYLANPFVGILNAYRFSFVSRHTADFPAGVDWVNTALIPATAAFTILCIGVAAFRKLEHRFYDHIHT
jgi:lipopolysaccharide transport system permease protein